MTLVLPRANGKYDTLDQQRLRQAIEQADRQNLKYTGDIHFAHRFFAEMYDKGGAVFNVKHPDFGATGDGVTDDTAALQAAHEAAQGATLVYPPGHYIISDTLPLYSKSRYVGQVGHTSSTGGVRIDMPAADAPLMASKGWLDDSAGGASGRLRISGFTLTGNRSNTSQHGIVIRDFFTTISDVRIFQVGGHGIWMTQLGSGGAAYTAGNLIENRVEDCDIGDLGAGAIYYYLGEDDNNKFTDGYLTNCKAWHDGFTPEHYVRVGSSVGWKFDGLHVYGDEDTADAPDIALYFRNGWNTTINNLYVESWRDVAVQVAAIQRATTATNWMVRGRFATGAETNNAVVLLSKSASVTRCEFELSNLAYDHPNDVAVTLISSAASTIDAYVSNEHISGDFAANVTPFGGSGVDSIRRVPDVVREGRVDEFDQERALLYDGRAVPYYLHTRRLSGADPQIVKFLLPKLVSFNALHGTIQIRGYDDSDPSIAEISAWAATISIFSRNNDTQNWGVYTTELVAPSGFDTNPAVSVDKSDNSLTLTWKWTDANTVGSGAIILTGGSGPLFS